ncbi:MAG TPA: DUF59 domain-containing protein, partial [Candidatus Binatia bacterium]|nr:DUF59 domain-containing protein [Candidatus Binatia bacterium]
EQEEKKTEHTSGAAGAAGNGHSVAAGTPEASEQGEPRHVPLPDVVLEQATVEAADPRLATDVAAPASDSAAAAETAAASAAGTGGESSAPLDIAKTEQLLIEAMHTVFDPEIPVDIYELGLIYDLRIREDGHVDIKMTLTTPNCPVAGSMPGMVERVAGMVEGVKDVKVELVWEPMWGPHMMTEAARLQLNMY